jgi:hypothetical protein
LGLIVCGSYERKSDFAGSPFGVCSYSEFSSGSSTLQLETSFFTAVQVQVPGTVSE